MRIYTEINWQWDDEQDKLVEVSSESQEYEGNVDLAMPEGDDDAGYFDLEYLTGGTTVNPMGSTAPIYNYWLNQLPQDVLQEIYGIFSEVNPVLCII